MTCRRIEERNARRWKLGKLTFQIYYTLVISGRDCVSDLHNNRVAFSLVTQNFKSVTEVCPRPREAHAKTVSSFHAFSFSTPNSVLPCVRGWMIKVDDTSCLNCLHHMYHIGKSYVWRKAAALSLWRYLPGKSGAETSDAIVRFTPSSQNRIQG